MQVYAASGSPLIKKVMETLKLKRNYYYQKKEKRYLKTVHFTNLKKNRKVEVECYLMNKESAVSGNSKFLEMKSVTAGQNVSISFPEHLTHKLEDIIGNYHAIDFLYNRVFEYGCILNLCVNINDDFKRMSLHATKYGEELIIELKDKRSNEYIPLALGRTDAKELYELLINFNHHKYTIWF